MKVKFKDVICMGNKTYMSGDVAELTDITGQQLIDQDYVELASDVDEVTDKSEEASKPVKKTTKKSE